MITRLIILIFIITGCKDNINKNTAIEKELFSKISPQVSNINFKNNLTQNNEFNIMTYDGFYLGAGIGVIDINKDGFQDLFFVSNQGPEKLYLNNGNFNFEDISESAGITGGNEWTAGVTIADVNGDGWDDIYICCKLFLDSEKRKNKLFINNKNNTFTEMAEKYGLADTGFSIHASFFDYDLDGDLDMYLVNQPPNEKYKKVEVLKKREVILEYSGKLYRNENNESFLDITEKAGIKNFGYSLSTCTADFFNDGYPDIYVANDYEEGDFFYHNSGEGQFSEIANNCFNHISNFSMGSDVADINNDGWLDIINVDMTAEDHYRNKTNMGGMNPEKFWKIVHEGHNHQYMFNSLQLNMGNGHFSEIGHQAGIAKTDWSWTPLLCDFDHDGYKDLYITNGILQDIRNRDYFLYAMEALKNKVPYLEIINKAPSVPLKNYMYKNDSKLHFENVTESWGLNEKTFSNGAAYSDLDNDGDMDIIVNNVNDTALIYRNNLDLNKSHFLKLKILEGKEKRTSVGARVMLCYDNNKIQMVELTNARGFMSTSEQIAHFGLGDINLIDSVLVRWPDGSFIRKDFVKTNQTLTLLKSEATEKRLDQFYKYVPFLLCSPIDKKQYPNIAHKENEFDDYKKEILIPYKQSSLGPGASTGDINHDGLDDIFIGGSIGYPCQMILQSQDGSYIEKIIGPWSKPQQADVVDVKIADFNGDKLLDIYTVSGGNENNEGSQNYQDHLYINKGNKIFKEVTNYLPKLNFSKSCITTGDIDSDGDLDIFIGGRLVPGKYGKFVNSKLLKNNNNNNFTDVTSLYNEVWNTDFGNVTDAEFVDIDQDNDLDLILCGEWMTIHIYIYENNKFIDKTKLYGCDSLFGFWNKIAIQDVNNDGLLDIVAGNIGLNTKFKASKSKPFSAYLNDFDENGTWDTYLASIDNSGKAYPVRGRQCSSEQMPFISNKFKNYNEFAEKSIDDILEGKTKNMIIRSATEFRSLVLINKKNSFTQIPLPPEAQIAPIYGIQFYDFNRDGYTDIITAGNFFNREIETTRSDAGMGNILINDSKGSFGNIVSSVTGLVLNQDCREIYLSTTKNKPYIIAVNNNSEIQINKIN